MKTVLSCCCQVYDTPPSGRWQRAAPSSFSHDDGIYDTPRCLPPQTDCETEVNTLFPGLLLTCLTFSLLFFFFFPLGAKLFKGTSRLSIVLFILTHSHNVSFPCVFLEVKVHFEQLSKGGASAPNTHVVTLRLLNVAPRETVFGSVGNRCIHVDTSSATDRTPCHHFFPHSSARVCE